MMLLNTLPRVAEVSERLPVVGLLVVFVSGSKKQQISSVCGKASPRWEAFPHVGSLADHP
jgi:hypothetical protein